MECLDFLPRLGGGDITASVNKFPPPERGRVRVGVRDMSRFTRSKKTTAKAKALRRSATEAEKVIWSRLRQAQLLGFSFRRQHSIGLFVLDFYCSTARLEVSSNLEGVLETIAGELAKSRVGIDPIEAQL